MRNFFIVGHNPNKVADAINYLRAGANALEPDIHFTNGDYYMGEGTTSTDLSLTAYLQSLTQLLNTDPSLIPALIMFDTKNSSGNIIPLFNIIQINFALQFNGTAILITRSQATEDEHSFFAPAANNLLANWALGVDEHTEPEFTDAFFKSMNIPRYTYADGISIQIPILTRIFWNRIKRAIKTRDTGKSFKITYSWTLDSNADIKAFLKLNADGMITDNPSALRQIITSPPFSTKYQLAKVGYNPFA